MAHTFVTIVINVQSFDIEELFLLVTQEYGTLFAKLTGLKFLLISLVTCAFILDLGDP